MFHHEPGMSVIDCLDEVQVRFSFPGNLRHRKNLRWMGCSPDAVIHSLHTDSTDMTVFFAHSMLLSSSSPCFEYLLAKALSQVNPLSISPDDLLRKRFELLQETNLSSLEIDETINLLTFRLMGRGSLYSHTGRMSPSCLEKRVVPFAIVQALPEPRPKNPVMLTVRAYCAMNGSVVLIVAGLDPVFFKYLLHCIYSEHFSMKKGHVELFVALINSINLINREKLTDLLIPFIEESSPPDLVNAPVPCNSSHWPPSPSSLPVYMEYGFPEGRPNNSLAANIRAAVVEETLLQDEPLDLSVPKPGTTSVNSFSFPFQKVSWQRPHREASTKEFDYLLTAAESRHCYSDAFRKMKSSTFSCGIFKTLMYPPLVNQGQPVSPDLPEEGTRLTLCPGGYFIDKCKDPSCLSQEELNPLILFPSQRVVDVPDRSPMPGIQFLTNDLKRGELAPTSVYSCYQFTNDFNVVKRLCPERELITPAPSRDGGSSSDPCCSGVSKPRPSKGSVQRPGALLADESFEEDSHPPEDPMNAAILLRDSLEKLEKNSAIQVRVAKKASLTFIKKDDSHRLSRGLPSYFGVDDLHPVVSGVVRSEFAVNNREDTSQDALPSMQCTELATLNPQATKHALHSSQASEPSIPYSPATRPTLHYSSATEFVPLNSEITELASPCLYRKKLPLPQSPTTEPALQIQGIESIPPLTQSTKAAQMSIPFVPIVKDGTAGNIRGTSNLVSMAPFPAELEVETIKSEEYKIEPPDLTEELTAPPSPLTPLGEIPELAIKIEEVHGGLLSPSLRLDSIDEAESSVSSTVHSSSPLMCLCCGIRFCDPIEIIPHMRQRHFSYLRSAPCADVRCPVQLLFCSSEWEVHVLHHVVKYSFRCGICSYSTKTAIGVSRHELSHRMAPRKAFKPIRKNQTRVSRVASRIAYSSNHKGLKGVIPPVCSPLPIQKKKKKNPSRGHLLPPNPASRLDSDDFPASQNASKPTRGLCNQLDKPPRQKKPKKYSLLKPRSTAAGKGKGAGAKERKEARSRNKTRTPRVSPGTGLPRLKGTTKKDNVVGSPKCLYPPFCPKGAKSSVRKRSKPLQKTPVVSSAKMEKPSVNDVADALPPLPSFPLPMPLPEPDPPRRLVRTKKVRVAARKKPRQRLVSCIFCSTTVSSREGLVNHYFHFHRFALPLPCPYEGCEFILKNSRHLHEHVGSHASKGARTRFPFGPISNVVPEIPGTRDGDNEGQLTTRPTPPNDLA